MSTLTPHPSFSSILPYFFPAEVLDAFFLVGTRIIRHARTGDETLEITLEELNAPPVPPPEHRGKHIESKGFHRPITVQHYPLQDKLCMLVIRRRRWEIEGVGTLERSLECLPLRGLKLTNTFAAFLKEADRTRPR